jgi:spoIIIJ-associated protein
MEWVETTGRTVEEALEFALDELGVDEADAEYEVLEEPKTGLFGRLRSEARVRARVRPTTPRPKEDRRGRGRKSAGSAGSRRSATETEAAVSDAAPAAGTARPPEAAPATPRRNTRAATKADDRPQDKEPQVSDTDTEVPVGEQGERGAEFVRGVLDRFGAADATVSTHELDEDTVEVRVEGGELGLLIGPKGATLQALQELTRTVVQRQTGARTGRLLLDVSGYRQRRKEALERFAHKIADDVLASGTRVVLEPMSPADRKIIHDTMNTIEGVSTSSEGEEPRRRVVVSPA